MSEFESSLLSPKCKWEESWNSKPTRVPWGSIPHRIILGVHEPWWLSSHHSSLSCLCHGGTMPHTMDICKAREDAGIRWDVGQNSYMVCSSFLEFLLFPSLFFYFKMKHRVYGALVSAIICISRTWVYFLPFCIFIKILPPSQHTS